MKTKREKTTIKSKGSLKGSSRSSTHIETGSASPSASKAHPVLHRYFGFCLYKAAMRFRGMMDEALIKYGLVTPQLGILRVINESGKISQQDIGDFVVIDKASMVKFLDQLEKLKLVNRQNHETDRRIKLVSLTPKGVKTLNELTELRKKIEAVFLQPLTLEEQDQLRLIVPKLLL